MKDMSAEEREMVEKFQGKGDGHTDQRTLIATPSCDVHVMLFIAAALCLVVGQVGRRPVLGYGHVLSHNGLRMGWSPFPNIVIKLRCLSSANEDAGNPDGARAFPLRGGAAKFRWALSGQFH